MYSSRRKSKQSHRKRVASRNNKTRSKRRYLKFRKMRGGEGDYRLDYGNVLNYPKDESNDYIVFEQTVGRMGTGPNRVSKLNRILLTDIAMDAHKRRLAQGVRDEEIERVLSNQYFVITEMESASPDALPKALYEKIGESNIVKRVGSYQGAMASEIKKLIFEN